MRLKRSFRLFLLFFAGMLSEPSALAGDDAVQRPPSAAELNPAEKPAGEAASEEEKSAPEKKEHKPNKLAGATSPYLLQHAKNPVYWYPWGEEALARAKKENKPIFLSIGYSSCHWCHVMEKESFEDEEIAALLNRFFICIKVDREERPDLDSIYMTALMVYNQLAGTGRGGGWPLSMFLTPSGNPFFGGSYFPARNGDRPGLPGFLPILEQVHKVWRDKPEQIQKDAEALTRFTKIELEGRRRIGIVPLKKNLVDDVQTALSEIYDPKYGGFGFSEAEALRPKFPEPANLEFLLHRAGQGNERAEAMLADTLSRMAQGGIHDQLGGGFHRYSVDRYWRVPHFEKMLYDNGQLLSIYSRAYEQTGRAEFRHAAEGIAQFVLRELTAAEGGFYSSLDADSEGEEGTFYVWTKPELQKVLTEQEFALVSKWYGLGKEPNFEEKSYVLEIDQPWRELSTSPADAREKELAPLKEKLLEVRAERERPATDTKILTAWNGLMIAGLADAGRILKKPEYTAAAIKAADFILANSATEGGRLIRSYPHGDRPLNAYLNDYAFLVHGLIALHRATGEEKWLAAANRFTESQLKLFWDEQRGGFFFTSDDHETLLARAKEQADGAVPSGNAVSALNLLYLAEKNNNEEYLTKARATVEAGTPTLSSSPLSASLLAVAADKLLQLPEEK